MINNQIFHTNGIKPVGVKKFYWYPTDRQWWITGFNPNETYHGAEKQYMVGSVCFIGHYDMYKTFKEKRKASDLSRFTVFDDKNKTVWISWYDYV